MSNFYSVLATAYQATVNTGGPANWQLPGVIEAGVQVYVDSYTALGTETTGAVIYLFTDGTNKVLPNGANILKIDFLVSVHSVGALTCSVGDLNSATRYASASSSFATSGTAFTIQGSVSATYVPYIIGTNPSTAGLGAVTNGDNQIILTTGGATLTAGTIITAMLYYTLAAQ